ncbi:hypothetical protein LCGC14_2726750, partial [marine sediment metagenome]
SRTFKKNDFEGCWILRVVGKSSRRTFADKIGFRINRKKERLLKSINPECKGWRTNDQDVIIGVKEAMQLAWDILPLPRKSHRSLFAARWGCQNVQRETLKKVCGLLRERGVLPPKVLSDIVDRDLMTVPVVSIEHDQKYCYDLSVNSEESYVAGGFLSHNTTAGVLGMIYKGPYLLSNMRDPARFFGLMSKSKIAFGIYATSLSKVSKVDFSDILEKIDACPYFNEMFPRLKHLTRSIRWPQKNMEMSYGSRELHALGENLYAFLMDEVNFMREKRDKDRGIVVGQAYDLYNATHSRIRSRFIRPGGTIPGIMLLMSSRNAQTSFLEAKLKKVQGSEYTFVSDYALWEVKSPKKYILSRFSVEVGDRISQSRMLEPDEKPRPNVKVVEGIPGEFKPSFEEDIDQALREIAGVATFNISPLIRDRQSI